MIHFFSLIFAGIAVKLEKVGSSFSIFNPSPPVSSAVTMPLIPLKPLIPYSHLFSRDLNFAKIFSAHFAIAEKNCVCRGFNFAKLTKMTLFFLFLTKIVR